MKIVLNVHQATQIAIRLNALNRQSPVSLNNQYIKMWCETNLLNVDWSQCIQDECVGCAHFGFGGDDCSHCIRNDEIDDNYIEENT